MIGFDEMRRREDASMKEEAKMIVGLLAKLCVVVLLSVFLWLVCCTLPLGLAGLVYFSKNWGIGLFGFASFSFLMLCCIGIEVTFGIGVLQLFARCEYCYTLRQAWLGLFSSDGDNGAPRNNNHSNDNLDLYNELVRAIPENVLLPRDFELLDERYPRCGQLVAWARGPHHDLAGALAEAPPGLPFDFFYELMYLRTQRWSVRANPLYVRTIATGLHELYLDIHRPSADRIGNADDDSAHDAAAAVPPLVERNQHNQPEDSAARSTASSNWRFIQGQLFSAIGSNEQAARALQAEDGNLPVLAANSKPLRLLHPKAHFNCSVCMEEALPEASISSSLSTTPRHQFSIWDWVETGLSRADRTLITKLRCGHAFHTLCAVQWFREAKNSTCPICRASLTQRKHQGKETSRDGFVVETYGWQGPSSEDSSSGARRKRRSSRPSSVWNTLGSWLGVGKREDEEEEEGEQKNLEEENREEDPSGNVAVAVGGGDDSPDPRLLDLGYDQPITQEAVVVEIESE